MSADDRSGPVDQWPEVQKIYEWLDRLAKEVDGMVGNEDYLVVDTKVRAYVRYLFDQCVGGVTDADELLSVATRAGGALVHFMNHLVWDTDQDSKDLETRMGESAEHHKEMMDAAERYNERWCQISDEGWEGG